MSIDGVGKPPGGPPGVGGVGGVGRSGESFRVDKTDANDRVAGSDALDQLQRGEISVDQYLDTRVEHAVQHLAARLSPEQLDFVKGSLREQLASDPVLVELVKRATGSGPTESR
jgi:hypothetical protein